MKQECIFFFLMVYNLTSRTNSLTNILSDTFLLCLYNQTRLDISNNEHVAITIKSNKSR